MTQLLNIEKENVIAAKIKGKITKRDIEKIHPMIHTITKKGHKVHFYFELEEFHGNGPKGLWADLKVDTAHISEYGKMAFVGEKKWQEWAVKAMDFFTGSEVKYFGFQDKAKAKNWIQNN